MKMGTIFTVQNLPSYKVLVQMLQYEKKKERKLPVLNFCRGI
jgi:hypothetical protein